MGFLGKASIICLLISASEATGIVQSELAKLHQLSQAGSTSLAQTGKFMNINGQLEKEDSMGWTTNQLTANELEKSQEKKRDNQQYDAQEVLNSFNKQNEQKAM